MARRLGPPHGTLPANRVNENFERNFVFPAQFFAQFSVDFAGHSVILRGVNVNATPACSSESRGILVLLGIKGFDDLARRSDVSRSTLSLMFYRAPRAVQFSLIAKVQDAMRSAYVERRKELTRAQAAYVCDYMNRWLRSMAGYVIMRRPRPSSPPGCPSSKDYRAKARKSRLAAMATWRWHI